MLLSEGFFFPFFFSQAQCNQKMGPDGTTMKKKKEKIEEDIDLLYMMHVNLLSWLN